MENLLDVLFSFYNKSFRRDVNFDIAAYFISHLNEIDQITIKDITTQCYTSTSTVNKFCQLLGYSNFKSFCHQVKVALYMKKMQVTTRMNSFNIDEMYHTYCSLFHETQPLEKEEWVEIAKSIATQIHESDQVVFYASVFPLALLSNFQFEMILTNKMIKTYDDFLKEEVHEFSANDLLFLISYTGAHFSSKAGLFYELGQTKAKKIVVSQRDYSNEQIVNVVSLIKLPNVVDCYENNIALMLFFDVIRYYYFKEYYDLSA